MLKLKTGQLFRVDTTDGEKRVGMLIRYDDSQGNEQMGYMLFKTFGSNPSYMFAFQSSFEDYHDSITRSRGTIVDLKINITEMMLRVCKDLGEVVK